MRHIPGQKISTMSFSEMVRSHCPQIASDLRLAIRITKRNRNHIARFGALSSEPCVLVPASFARCASKKGWKQIKKTH